MDLGSQADRGQETRNDCISKEQLQEPVNTMDSASMAPTPPSTGCTSSLDGVDAVLSSLKGKKTPFPSDSGISSVLGQSVAELTSGAVLKDGRDQPF